MERTQRPRRQQDEPRARPRLRNDVDQRRTPYPCDLLALPVPGLMADALADVGPGAPRLLRCRLRFHDDALPEPSLRAALATALGPSWRRPALRLQRRHPPSAAPDSRH